MSNAAGVIYLFQKSQLTPIRSVNAPIAGLSILVNSLIWSHTIAGCILGAPLGTPSEFETIYAGASTAVGLQVFMKNDTPHAAWRYSPASPTTVQVLSLASTSQQIEVAVVTSFPLQDFVYFEHIEKAYYRSVPGIFF